MKRLFVFSALVLSGFFVNAQGFSFGPKVGANITGNSGLQFKNGYNFGYHLGGFAEVMLSKTIGIQPELLWSQTSLTTSSSLSDIYSTSLPELTKIKLNYITIPLLLNIRPAKFITFQVGPQFGILQDKKNSVATNVQSAFKSGDFSMLAGIQLKVLAFRFYGRYGIGLSNINDLANQDAWKSKTLQLGIGLGL
ncbi:MAG: hypothetical protein RLZZ595_1985 [Bacteroidota bacterium]|jgi:hypothetical protein